jgi:phage shock protein PspC (stress-responsive transcriptional regulator)
MKTTVQINLGGYPFVLDDDAYARLSSYIEALRVHFENTEGADEIVGDIESRMAEIISDKLGSRPIVSLADIHDTITIMGTPKDFGMDTPEEPTGRSQKHTFYGVSTGKKLFRSADDKVLGGVCAGLAAYFGIKEPLWVRLLFALALFGFGVGLIPYLLLWILLPQAKTSAEKLAMRGEPINVESIAKTVSEGVQNLGEQLGSWKNDTNHPNTNRFTDILNTLFSFGGEVILAVVNFLSKYLRLFVWIAALVLLFVLGIFCIAVFFGATVSFPFVNTFLLGSFSQTLLVAVSGFFIVFLPLLLIIWLIIQAIYRKPTPIGWIVGGTILWFGTLSIMGNRVAHTAEQFNVVGSTKKLVPLTPSAANELRLTSKHREQQGVIQFGPVHVQKDHLASSDIQLNVLKSTDEAFHLEQSVVGRGASQEDALLNIQNINYTLEQRTGELVFDNLFYLPSGQKFRNQKIRFDLQVPIGGSVYLDEYMIANILDIDPAYMNNVSLWDYDFNTNPYLKLEMTAQGIRCVQCPKIQTNDEDEDVQDPEQPAEDTL